MKDLQWGQRWMRVLLCFRLSFCSNLPDMFVGCLLGMVSSFRGQGEHLFIHTVFITLHGAVEGWLCLNGVTRIGGVEQKSKSSA